MGVAPGGAGRGPADTIPPTTVARRKAKLARALLLAQFQARPQQLEPAEAVYATRALATSEAFPAALEWLFANRAQGLEEIRCPVTTPGGHGT